MTAMVSSPCVAIYLSCSQWCPAAVLAVDVEIRQVGPGHCPKCGMALEPLMPTEGRTLASSRACRLGLRLIFREFREVLCRKIPICQLIDHRVDMISALVL